MNEKSREMARENMASARPVPARREIPTTHQEIKETVMGHDALKAPGVTADAPTLNIEDQPAGQAVAEHAPAGPRNLPPGHPDSPGHPSKQPKPAAK